MIQKSISFILLLSLSSCISMTISSLKDRCMIVSSNSDDHYLKIDVKFNKFQNQKPNQGFLMHLHNTQTSQIQSYQITGGVFRKQFKLTENVVYDLCFRIVLNHNIQITSIMQYNAGVKHRHLFQSTNLTIPKSLLMIDDLKRTYKSLHQIKQLTDNIKNSSEARLKSDFYDYQMIQEKIDSLSTISIIELVVIVVFSIIQFKRMLNIIQGKSK